MVRLPWNGADSVSGILGRGLLRWVFAVIGVVICAMLVFGSPVAGYGFENARAASSPALPPLQAASGHHFSSFEPHAGPASGASPFVVPNLLVAAGVENQVEGVSGPHADYYDQMLMVEFDPRYAVRLRLGEFVDLNRLADPVELARLAELGGWERAYTMDEGLLDEMRAKAASIKNEPMPDLNNYYYFYPQPGQTIEAARTLLRALPLLSFVDYIPVAYPTQEIPNYADPAPGIIYQRYLDPAPSGIDARWAWLGTGGKGENVRICNIEYGYNASHVDLPPITVLGTPYFGTYEEHGTAVMGILGAPDNGFGVTGIAHRAKFYFSFVGPNNVLRDLHDTHIHNAIFRCLNALSPGDIILVEQQIAGPNRPPGLPESDHTGLVAVDWYKPFYDASQIASAMVMVVQAAGNGGEWLDSPVYMLESQHNPFVLATRSGALIVGSANTPYDGILTEDLIPRAASASTNHGTIVRMQGWARHIAAPGYGLVHPGADEDGNVDQSMRNEFYTQFSGTSGASPIVVGAAAAIQSIHKEIFGHHLWPNQLEALMRETGTPQAGANVIGPQPDIRAAVEKLFIDAGMTIGAAAPVFNPPGGTYAMPLSIQIGYGDANQNKNNTLIRFTLDGSQPTFDHGWQFVPEETPTWNMSYGATLRAVAFRYDTAAKRWYESDTVTHTYVSTTPMVAFPNIILPGPGPEFSAPLTVQLNTFTPDATIRYRTDGKNINFFNPGTVYTGPFELGPGQYTIVARAYKDGYYSSSQVKSNLLNVLAPFLPPPIVSPGGGSYVGGVEVAMTHSMLEAEIRYTTDGSNVTPDSPLYSEPFWLNHSATIRARAYRTGYAPSAQTFSAVFDITSVALPPKFSPEPGTYSGSVLVTIVPPVGATEVRYSTNGSEPGRGSAVYSGPFTLGIGQHTVKARTYMQGGLQSETATAVYTVYDPNPEQVVAPIFDPGGGNHTQAVTITMRSNTEGATLRYTLSPLEPEDQWLTYTEPVVLGPNPDGYVIRAKAYKHGMADSDFTQASFGVFSPVGTVETPWITPPGGAYTDTIQVTLNLTRTPPSKVPMLYHTTDGSLPVVPPNTPGSTPPTSFNLSQPTHVQVIGAQLGYFNSPVVEAEYTFYCAPPLLTPGGIFTQSVMVEMSTSTPNATIHYTIDGSTPTQQSPAYTEPFELNEGEYLVQARCYRSNFETLHTIQHVYMIEPPPAPPTLREEPVDLAAFLGESVRFEAELDDETPEDAHYQWQRDGVNLLGANEPILEIPAARSDYVGAYRLLVRTPGGMVASREATLALADVPIDGLAADNNGPTPLGQPTQLFATVTSGTGISYTWDFGDDTGGSGPTPSHTYGGLGTYTAVVTATNGSSIQSAMTTVIVTDTVAPITGLVAVNSGPTELGRSTRFTATVTGGTAITYTWEFGDGTVGSGTSGSGPAPAHVYTQTGTYTATVTAVNSQNSESAQTVVEVRRPVRAIAGLSASNDSPTQLGMPTAFTAAVEDGTDVVFVWEFGDGETGNGPTPSHTYADPGTYTAAVFASNGAGTVIITTTVTVAEGDLPIESLTVTTTSPTELGEPTHFAALASGTGISYTWEFGDGETGSGASPSHVYTQTGTYTAVVTARNDKSERSAEAVVLVQITTIPIEELEMVVPETPRAGASIAFRARVGAGSNVVYTWEFGDGNSATGATVNHTYAGPGEYQVRLIADNGLGEPVVVERMITVCAVESAEIEPLPNLFLPGVQR